MAKADEKPNEILGETTEEGLPLPEKLGAVNSGWFIKLIEAIDELFYSKHENEEDKVLLGKIIKNIEESIVDHANDYNIMTSDTFDGSQPILSEYLKKLKRYVTKIRIDLDQDVKASEVVTNKRYAGALSRDVESALDAIEQTITSTGQTINQLTSESIKHKKTTVYDELEKSDSRLFSLEAKVGSGLEASNIKTNKRYQGSSQNVESALGAIDQAVIDVASTAKQNKGDIVSLNDKVAKLQSGSEVPLTSNMINHSSKNIKATNVRDALEELFTYADDVHARWASSVGAPLSKGDTAEIKGKKTKELIEEGRNNLKRYGVSTPRNTMKEVVDGIKKITILGIEEYYDRNKTTKMIVNSPTDRPGYVNIKGRLEVSGQILQWSFDHSAISLEGTGGWTVDSGSYRNPKLFKDGSSSSDVEWVDVNVLDWNISRGLGDGHSYNVYVAYIGDVIKTPTMESDREYTEFP